MNSTDKLQAIKAKCEALIEGVTSRAVRDTTIISSYSDASIAGWRATIAAVTDILEYYSLHSGTEIERDILAAWEGQV